MRIMLTDDTATSREVGDALAARGHEVVADCLPFDGTGRCRGVDEATCPLDAGVDIALSSSDHHQEVATAGIVCATRRSVPVIQVGRQDAGHPDLEQVLLRTARRGDERITTSVDHTLRAELLALGLEPGVVTVERAPDRERIIATLPEAVSERIRSRVAVSLLSAATRTGRQSIKRDVVVRVAG